MVINVEIMQETHIIMEIWCGWGPAGGKNYAGKRIIMEIWCGWGPAGGFEKHAFLRQSDDFGMAESI